MTVEELDKLALERYETGGDVFIECWDKAEKQEMLDEQGDKALEWVTMLMDNWHERANAARNEMF
jgi:hypothetical protein